MTAKRRIILVHGAWADASTWDQVVAVLQQAGHDVAAIDLPGHGADTTLPGDVRLADYAGRVADALDSDEPALLVGHSMGGMAISAGAELVPDGVHRLVYVAAFLPRNGQSLLDLIKQQNEPGLRDIVRPAEAERVTVLDPALAGDILFQDANAAQRSRALGALGSQPNQVQTDPATLTADRFGAIPRTYVVCEQDRTIVPALQRKMVALSPCDAVHALDCGHVPQLTRARELADIFCQL